MRSILRTSRTLDKDFLPQKGLQYTEFGPQEPPDAARKFEAGRQDPESSVGELLDAIREAAISWLAPMTEQELREKIVEIGSRLYAREYIVAGDGNLSVRLPGTNEILATPTGVCKGFLTPEMVVRVDLGGRKVDGTHDPSSELAMHLQIYRLRPDVGAVVHAHPPCGTGFAAAGLALDKAVISEVVLTLGCIPIAAYGTPSTQELADSIAPYVPSFDALLLANHGALTYGPSLESAYFRMETLEHFARISLVARLLGGEQPLDPRAVQKLFAIRERTGAASPTTALCAGSSDRISASTSAGTDGDERITLRRGDLVQLIADSVELAARLLEGAVRGEKR